MTWLLNIAASKVIPEVDEEHFEDLVETAEEMIRAGIVTVSPGEWGMLSQTERNAFVYAAEKVHTTRATKSASMVTPEGVAAAMEPLDGGRQLADLALRREMEKVAADLRSGKSGVSA